MPAKILFVFLVFIADADDRGVTTFDAAAANAAAEAASAGTCGVSGFVKRDGTQWVNVDMRPQCNRLMTTNCSVSYRPMRCPDNCSFIVPNEAFSCLFVCAPPEQCGTTNPNRAYPNPVNRICSACSIRGCRWCGSKDVCLACHPGFQLSGSGSSCVFTLDQYLEGIPIMKVLIILVMVLVALACSWLVKYGAHPNQIRNSVALRRAKKHRKLVKVHDWNLSGRKIRQRYNLGINIHTVNILGVGLPLFYNGICFLMAISALFLGVTYFVFSTSNASLALSTYGRDLYSLESAAITPAEEAPAVVLSPLAGCSSAAASDVSSKLRDFADVNFKALGILYSVTFVLSITYCWFQRMYAQWFDKANATMADYAVRLEGLPVSDTDEAGIRDWLEAEFQRIVPHDVDRSFGGVDHAPGPVQVYGVSLCYDYRECTCTVDETLFHLIERIEVESLRAHGRQKAHSNYMETVTTTATLEHKTIEEEEEDDRDKVLPLFEGNKKLRTSGEAFVVFKYLSDKEAVLRAYRDNPTFLKHPAEPMREIAMHHVASEPPAILWQNMGTTSREVKLNTARAVLKLIVMILCVQFFIMFPYTIYIVWPYMSIGSAAGGVKMTISGIVLGNINMFLGISIYMTAYGLGFVAKDKMDCLILGLNTVLVAINTFFNLLVTNEAVLKRNGAGESLGIRLSVDSVAAIVNESALAENMYTMLMPGTFFLGYMMCIIMAGVVPYIWNYFLMKVIYIWQCLPTCLLYAVKVFLPWAPDSLDVYPSRYAEKGLEPMEISIAWDYSCFIVNPMVCFSMLFFMSPYVWRTFLAMLAWTIFYYFYCRFMHLRFCKTCFYTTHLMDCLVNFIWGFPLSVVAAAWCFWGIRSGNVAVGWPAYAKLGLVLMSFFVSLALWFMSFGLTVNLSKVRDPEEDHNLTVEEVQAESLYTWFNCNPVYVLKCEYFFKDQPHRRRGHPLACGDDREVVLPFEIGKEYLFLAREKQKGARTPSGDFLEFETYLEKLIDLMGQVVSPFLGKAEQQGYALLTQAAAITRSRSNNLASSLLLAVDGARQKG